MPTEKTTTESKGQPSGRMGIVFSSRVEAALQAPARALVQPLLSESGGLRAVTLDHSLEEELGRAFGGPIPAGSASLQPPFARRILDGLRRLAGDHVAVASPVLLCSTPARYYLKRLLEPFLPKSGGALTARGAPGHRGPVARGPALMPGLDRDKHFRSEHGSRN